MRILVAHFRPLDPESGGVGGTQWRAGSGAQFDLVAFVKREIQCDYDVLVTVGYLELDPDAGIIQTDDPKDLRPSERRAISTWVHEQAEEGNIIAPEDLIVHPPAGPGISVDMAFARVASEAMRS